MGFLEFDFESWRITLLNLLGLFKSSKSLGLLEIKVLCVCVCELKTGKEFEFMMNRNR